MAYCTTNRYRCAKSAPRHASLVLVEQITQEFRAALHHRGIVGWRIAIGWFNTDLDLTVEQAEHFGSVDASYRPHQ